MIGRHHNYSDILEKIKVLMKMHVDYFLYILYVVLQLALPLLAISKRENMFKNKFLASAIY